MFSCVGAKKMRQTSQQLNAIQTKQAGENNKVAAIASTGEAKLADGKIDSNINARLQQRLNVIRHQLDSINTEIAGLRRLTENKKDFRGAYKKEIVPKLSQLDTFYKKYDERMKVYLMLEDGVNTANYTLFDLAAFFGPGVYSIPPDKDQLAGQSFMPLVDSLISFSNRYDSTSRTATLVILGFADGQNIGAGTALHDTLSSMLATQDATKEVLNKKLSELRALELIKQLTAMFKQKVPSIKNIDQLNVEYIGQGKGEEYPIPTIKDYKEDDERRRIVLCYWAVLPNIQ
jgi:hypothetical protein